jgi:protease-4
MLRWIGRALVTLFAVIGLLTVLLVTGLAWQIGRIFEAPALAVPETVVLELDLTQPLPEGPPAAGFAPFQPRPTTVRETVAAIDLAAADDRVAALRAELAGDVFGLAAAQEIRAAVERFREAGKPAIAYAESYGAFGNGTASYYLASAFDEIWMRPIGSVGATGIYMEMPFANALLTDLGLEPEFVREGEYKTFPELFTETGFTEPHREMLESISDSLYGQVVAGIAAGRGLDEAEVVGLIDRAPLLAEDAREAGLVDRLDTRDALDEAIGERFGEDAGGLSPQDYLRAASPPAGEARIALIFGIGTIVLEDGGQVPGLGQELMGAYRIAETIDDAVANRDVDAIVLRIDSGGGSAVASAVIGDAVRRAMDAGTPVVVSMAGAAASGGYWLSAPATAIVAQPATLTGSIGVFAGAVDSRALWQEVGVNWGAVQRGGNAELASAVRGFSEDGRARVESFVDALYARFVAVVAEGRSMDPAAVREIARGRVWTGAQAAERGLVDRLGGLEEAFAEARLALDLREGAPLDVVALPEPPSPLEQLRRLLSMPAGEAAMAAALERLHPAVRELVVLAESPEDRLLHMPPMVLRP